MQNAIPEPPPIPEPVVEEKKVDGKKPWSTGAKWNGDKTGFCVEEGWHNKVRINKDDKWCPERFTDFTFPSVLHEGGIPNDTWVKVKEVDPLGPISDDGVKYIKSVLRDWISQADADNLAKDIDWYVESVNKKRPGKITKRISKAMHDKGFEMGKGQLELVGSYAEKYREKSQEIMFTRHWNLPPETFLNKNSCLWGTSLTHARCMLKWGGCIIAMIREGEGKTPYSRFFVQPMDYVHYSRLSYGRDSGFNVLQKAPVRTGEMLAAVSHTDTPAYFLANQYGPTKLRDLGKIIAELTGKTQVLEVSHSPDGAYFNSGQGVAVMNAETREKEKGRYLSMGYSSPCSCGSQYYWSREEVGK